MKNVILFLKFSDTLLVSALKSVFKNNLKKGKLKNERISKNCIGCHCSGCSS